MRLIMMGTGPFAVPTFRSLFESPHELCALVTRPSISGPTRDKTKSPPNLMRELAESRGLKVLSPSDVNLPESHRELAELRPDLFVVCDYGQILSPETLGIAPLGGINLHGSLLPKFRGAAPVQWAIWRGEQESGITVIHMTPGLDAGPSLVQRKTAIGSTETAAELEPRLAELGVEPVHEAIAMLAKWDRASQLGTAQDPAQATRARRLKKSDGEVIWTQTGEQILRQFRAVQPWPGLYTHLLRSENKPLRVILEKVEVVPGVGNQTPGTVIQSTDGRLIVATGGEALSIVKLQPAGKRVLEAAEFLRGYPLGADAKFGASSEA